MIIRVGVYFLSLVFLCSCFLKQTEPTPTTNPKTPVIGVVVLEDIQGDSTGAAIMAAFKEDKSSSQRSARSPDVRKEIRGLSLRGGGGDNRDALCSGCVSLGELSFGPALQTTLMSIDELEDHSYVKPLEPDFPPGQYYVIAEGTKKFTSFQGYLPFPERLREVSANGTDFGSSTVLIRKDEDLEITWRMPAAINDKSILLVDIVRVEDKALLLRYRTEEAKYLGDDNILKFSIPQEKVSLLPETSEVWLYFSRVLVEDIITPEINVQLQGFRTQLANAEILEE